MQIIKEVINPAFKANELPEITVRIGLAYGYALVVLYGKSLEKAHIDIIGSSISLAAKIASIAKPNQVLVGEYIYNILVCHHREPQRFFKQYQVYRGKSRSNKMEISFSF